MANDEENKKFPSTDWAYKLNKQPSTVTFIVAVPQYSFKPLSKAGTSVLKLMYKQIETLNFKMHYILGSNHFSQYKTTSSLLMQSKKLTAEIKHYYQ